jgi:4-hydroxy-tetrahydrodipicolinate synthase
MLTRKEMKGVCALPPTPFTQAGELDEAAWRENTIKLCEAGVHMILCTGTLGEGHTMPDPMRRRAYEILVEETRPRGVFSICGASASHTEAAISLCQYAMEIGADAIMNLLPFYVPLTREEMLRYYQDLAEACPEVGICVYNNCDVTQMLIDAELFEEFAKIPNFCGSKEISPDIAHWLSLQGIGDLGFLWGEMWGTTAMFTGGTGFVSTVACIAPSVVLGLYEACTARDWERAFELQHAVNEIVAVREMYLGTPPPFEIQGARLWGWSYCKHNDISMYKGAVTAAGFLKAGYPRKPFIPVPDEVVADMRRRFRTLGVVS